MNELLGQVFTGLIIDENETMYLVQKNGVTFHFEKKQEEVYQIGESVEGFGYVNQKKKRFLQRISHKFVSDIMHLEKSQMFVGI